MVTEPDDGTVRWPLIAKIGIGLAVLTVVGGIAAALIAAFVIDRDDAVLVSDALDPVAPVAYDDGQVVYAERTTGNVVVVDGGSVRNLASVPDELRTDGQRGLLGLAVREEAEQPAIYASWTRASDDRLVVGMVFPRTEMVWEGPVSTDVANGGTLVFRGDELLIGIGELQDPEAADDPDRPNGKILALDPDGPLDQEPEVLSGGWHNPFALTVVGDDVWLVDNAPGSVPERIARTSPDGTTDVLDLAGRRAPSSLAVLADGDLALCGFVSGVVERITVLDTGLPELAEEPTDVIGPSCATGVAVLADGTIVTTTTDQVLRAGA